MATLRALGRVAIWAALALLLVRGGAAVLTSGSSEEAPVHSGAAEGPGPAAEAIAIGFARAWLENPEPRTLAPYLARGAELSRGTAPGEAGQVAQAEVAQTTNLGGGRWVLTVSCQLRDARVLDLAVPIARPRAGEAAVMGAPSIVAVPAPAGAVTERPRPIAGPEAEAIAELVAKFIPAYLSAGSSTELSYLLAPGSAVVPLGGSVELTSAGEARQLGDGEGSRRELIAPARVTDGASGAIYPVVYRLRAVQRAGRWYVAAVEGSDA